MTRRHRIGILLLLLPSLLAAEGTGEVLVPDTGDRAIALQVEEQLTWDDRIDFTDLEVSVEDGAVTIVGTVDSYAARQLVTADALAVPGVRTVDNRTVVEYDTAFPRLVEQNVREILDTNPWLDEENIDIELNEDLITLSGRVDELWKKQEAAELAASVTGVDRVVNELVVVPSDDIVDELIAQEIRRALERNNNVDESQITIAVSEGKALLTGIVENLSAKRAAYHAALYTGGITEIINEIEVDPPGPDVAAEELKARVTEQLAWDTRVDADQILVEIEGSAVILRGRVETAAERQLAEESVETVPDVREVLNQLEVAGTPELTLDATMERTIRNVLQVNPAINAADVDVSVEEGMVLLTGSVDSLWKKDRAEDLAGSLNGILGVENLLAVVPTEDYADEEIAEEVVAALARNESVETEEIDVRVENGIVTLLGTVSSPGAARAAYSTAALTAGVREVIDRMVVE